MNRQEFDKIAGDGKIASCEFITKPNKEFPAGRLRKMVFRTKVTKGVTGEGMKYDPNKLGLRTVFDMQKRGFRHVNLNTIQWITAHGETHHVGYQRYQRNEHGDLIDMDSFGDKIV